MTFMAERIIAVIIHYVYLPLIFLQAICDGSTFYGNLCHMKLMTAGYYDEEGAFDVTEEV